MRPPELRLVADDGLIVDNFAGGGGASHGIEQALGRSPDIAINHDADAIAMHQQNHPETRHYCEDVWEIDPREATGGRPVALAWFSPDCKHFSKAKGGKPVDRNIRGLAWVAVRWARDVRPRVMILENVEEFAHWGPLLDDGRPDPSRRGATFRRWIDSLEQLGYQVEWRELRACDYGAPTTRRRLFVIARCDGRPIAWPVPTHGPDLEPYRTAATCIEWSVPAPSIFERRRPLADKTLRRIARGVDRFVINAAEPFIVPVTHAGDHRVHSVNEPLRTVTAAHRGELSLVAPTLIQQSWGERPGQAPRVPGLHKPLGTVVAGGIKHAVVAAFLAKHNGGHEATGADLRGPLHTRTARDSHALVASHILKFKGTGTGHRMDEPLHTVQAGGQHYAQVMAFMLKYYGTAVGQDVRDPMHTQTARSRFAIVMVHGQAYAIADIGMRMLIPRELYRGQGFPDSYVIDHALGRRLTKTAQVRMCGNSVPPPVATAIVRANLAPSRPVEVATW